MNFDVGSLVHKKTGDYWFGGIIVAKFHKQNNKNAIRVVVENIDGVLMIFNPNQLEEWNSVGKYEQ